MNEQTFRKKRMGILLWSLLGLLLASIVILMALKKPAEKKPVPEEVPTPVSTIRLEPQDITETVRIPGKLEPLLSARLAAAQEGLIMEVGAEKGASVTNGQILLRVDSRQWEQVRQRAEIEIRESEKDVARWTELKRAGAVSVNDFDSIRTRREQAEIALAEANVFLSQCEVASPMDGLVNDRMIELGEYINKGAPAFEVVDIRQVKLMLDVPERDILAVKDGLPIRFELASYPGESFTGVVSFISLLAQKESNAFRIEALADNPQGRLKPGMIAGVDLVRRTRAGSLLAPLQAILPRKGEYVVFVVEDGRAIRRVVQVESIVGHSAVINGLNAGDELVVAGHRALQDGMRVERTTGEQAPSPEADGTGD